MLGAGINYWAVLVSGVVMFMLGGLWYSPVLFARPWTALLGKDPEELKKGGKPIHYLVALISALVTAWVMALILGGIHVTSLLGGVHVAFLCWLGFAGATSLMHSIFSLKPLGLWLIDTGYSLATFVVAALILVSWH